ncbi:MAG: thiol:disulfide interchange protein DsbA/DsbL [Gallionella sp.]|nr:thiol:disulfide interchange protein DsbA/DsbL [Gallionella sp.]MDP1941917.1 thiol:disulfide interchange protein DsbA/DsbL [Gallionella sp.]
MKNIFKSLFVAAFFLLGSSAFAAAPAGKGYTLLNPAQPASSKKIEVLEFFFYECSHCFYLHGELAAWEKTMPADVELTFVPTIFRDSTEPLARTFYALESIGKIKQMDDAIYQAIHVKQANLYDLNTIGAFVGSNGVDRSKFSAAYNSFTVNSKVVRAKQMIRSYGINGTPTLVVDGKYAITGLQPADTIRVLNEVLAMVRKSRSAESKTKSK